MKPVRNCCKLTVTLLLLFICFNHAMAQDSILFHYSRPISENDARVDSYFVSEQVLDPGTIISAHCDSLIIAGYLSLGLDSLHFRSGRTDVYINPGIKYTLISDQVNILAGQSSAALLLPLKDTVSSLAQSGYPFATARISAKYGPDSTITLEKVIEPGKKYYFGGISCSGNLNPDKSYLETISRLSPGDIYREGILTELEKMFGQADIYRLNGKASLTFSDSLFFISLNLRYRLKPSFSGLIGLNPSQGGNRLSLSGDLQAYLPGLLNHGDWLRVRWMSPVAGSQELSASFYYPYLAGFRWSVKSDFNLKKIDTLYFNNELRLSLLFLKDDRLRSGLSYRLWSGSALGVDASPSIKHLLGLTLSSGPAQPEANPGNGHKLELGIETGYIRNDSWSDLTKPIVRFQSGLEFSQYIPLKSKVILHYRLDAAILAGDSINQAELYRIGGNRLLRGFDEESYLASAYMVASLGLRYRPDEITFAGVFCDVGMLQTVGIPGKRYFYAPGLEAGIGSENFMIIIRYAIGHEWGHAFSLNQGRLHLGLVLGAS
jgi:hypothetical protein